MSQSLLLLVDEWHWATKAAFGASRSDNEAIPQPLSSGCFIRPSSRDKWLMMPTIIAERFEIHPEPVRLLLSVSFPGHSPGPPASLGTEHQFPVVGGHSMRTGSDLSPFALVASCDLIITECSPCRWYWQGCRLVFLKATLVLWRDWAQNTDGIKLTARLLWRYRPMSVVNKLLN